MIVARATADLHLSTVTAPLVFRALEQLRADTEARGGVTVICGDILDTAETVHAETFLRLFTMLRGWPQPLVLIPGNHDQIGTSGDTLLDVIADGGRMVTTVRCATRSELGLLVPYLAPEQFRAAVRDPPVKLKIPERAIWWAHQGWAGAYMTTMRRDRDGLPLAAVDAELVVTGHYHYPHSIGAVVYCGSPYQIGFSEEGQEKSWLRWDDELWPTRVPYDIGAPRHYTVRWDPERGEPSVPAGAVIGVDRIRVMTPVDRQIARKAVDQLTRAGLDGVPVIASVPDSSIRAVEAGGDPWSAAEQWVAGRFGGDPRGPDPEAIREVAEEHGLWRG